MAIEAYIYIVYKLYMAIKRSIKKKTFMSYIYLYITMNVNYYKNQNI